MKKQHWMLIATIALASTVANAAGDQATPEVQSVNGVTYVSGGVGDESMAQLVSLEKAFDLKLFLVGKSGTYLSDVHVGISDAQGQIVLDVTSDGPILLTKIPSGTYTIKASRNNGAAQQIINVNSDQLRTIYMRLPD